MIGESQEFTDIIEMSKKAANFTSNVLILGESGTGKELFARSIHNYNKPISTPFIAINCAAIPESLLESELFGYEEGAFTGAKQTGKPGKFELANGGTIFLDEIGDMPLHLQAKILRVLQDRTIERIGGINPIPINVRVIAATNKNLMKMVENKEFREDLYYRLNVFNITIPSLRERPGDIPLLIDYFLDMYCNKFGVAKKGIEAGAMAILINHQWKGNIRELQNTIEYLCCICEDDIIEVENVRSKIPLNDYTEMVIKEDEIIEIIPIDELEKREIKKALDKYGHTTVGKLQAAQALNIGKSTLYRKLKEYNID
ncbi:sigma 54-interacting transcriptional regulator [Tissierella carlieri]|uniref:Sigma 54-interacting transcriptional regulator n=2 Tax=Tissierella carlieri TaxID=689904 RepID=A0ABT1SD13_9FIRM|nr:sigma 54-interacting transcriptional regulator [Tissierella carlieri]